MGDAEFKASTVADLKDLLAFVARVSAEAGADGDSRFALRLAVEEWFTDVMQYAYGPGGGPLNVSLKRGSEGITVVMRDFGPPFDPTNAPAPDLGSDWRERSPGGLGLHLMRHMMDRVDYERGNGGENILTLVKNLPAGRQGHGAGASQ